jgi:hypothetical protein
MGNNGKFDGTDNAGAVYVGKNQQPKNMDVTASQTGEGAMSSDNGKDGDE